MMVPRKANSPVMTREQIVAAAIAVVDRDGLDALSMRKLAAELGVGPMSLYYHVPDKSALYDLILEALMSGADFSGDDPNAPADERIIAMAYQLRETLLAHPHAVPIALSRSLRTTGQLKPVDGLLGILFDVGMDATDAITAVDVIGTFVFGMTLSCANQLTEAEAREGDPAEEAFGAIDPEQLPNVVRCMQEAEYVGWDGEFDRGLRALVKGLVTDRIPPGGTRS